MTSQIHHYSISFLLQAGFTKWLGILQLTCLLYLAQNTVHFPGDLDHSQLYQILCMLSLMSSSAHLTMGKMEQSWSQYYHLPLHLTTSGKFHISQSPITFLLVPLVDFTLFSPNSFSSIIYASYGDWYKSPAVVPACYDTGAISTAGACSHWCSFPINF